MNKSDIIKIINIIAIIFVAIIISETIKKLFLRDQSDSALSEISKIERLIEIQNKKIDSLKINFLVVDTQIIKERERIHTIEIRYEKITDSIDHFTGSQHALFFSGYVQNDDIR
jgi:hypothetical protein